jgi:hypothetical protein
MMAGPTSLSWAVGFLAATVGAYDYRYPLLQPQSFGHVRAAYLRSQHRKPVPGAR